MAAIFKSSLQNLSPLPTSLKVEPLARPKTSHKFFVNTSKSKTKVLAVLGQTLETPFVIMGPEHLKVTNGLLGHLSSVAFKICYTFC